MPASVTGEKFVQRSAVVIHRLAKKRIHLLVGLTIRRKFQGILLTARTLSNGSDITLGARFAPLLVQSTRWRFRRR